MGPRSKGGIDLRSTRSALPLGAILTCTHILTLGRNGDARGGIACFPYGEIAGVSNRIQPAPDGAVRTLPSAACSRFTGPRRILDAWTPQIRNEVCRPANDIGS